MCNKLKWTGLLDGNEAGEKLFSVKGHKPAKSVLELRRAK